MPAALDALVIALYVQIDDFLGPRHRGRGRPPKLTDSELITLAVAQVLLGVPNDRQFLALARLGEVRQRGTAQTALLVLAQGCSRHDDVSNLRTALRGRRMLTRPGRASRLRRA